MKTCLCVLVFAAVSLASIGSVSAKETDATEFIGILQIANELGMPKNLDWMSPVATSDETSARRRDLETYSKQKAWQIKTWKRLLDSPSVSKWSFSAECRIGFCRIIPYLGASRESRTIHNPVNWSVEETHMLKEPLTNRSYICGGNACELESTWKAVNPFLWTRASYKQETAK